MSHGPDKSNDNRWRAIALTWLAYAIVVVIVVALVGPLIGRGMAWIAYVLFGMAALLRRKRRHLPVEVEDHEYARAEPPAAAPDSI